MWYFYITQQYGEEHTFWYKEVPLISSLSIEDLQNFAVFKILEDKLGFDKKVSQVDLTYFRFFWKT